MDSIGHLALTAISPSGKTAILDIAAGADARRILTTFLKVCVEMFDRQGFHSYRICTPPPVLGETQAATTAPKPAHETRETILALRAPSGAEVKVEVARKLDGWYVQQTSRDWLASRRAEGPFITREDAIAIAKARRPSPPLAQEQVQEPEPTIAPAICH